MLSVKNYTLGHTVQSLARFRDESNDLFSPTTVTAEAKKPSGDTEVLVVTELEEGVFVVEIPTDETGVWYYRVEGTEASVIRAAEGSFCVKPSSVEG